GLSRTRLRADFKDVAIRSSRGPPAATPQAWPPPPGPAGPPGAAGGGLTRAARRRAGANRSAGCVCFAVGAEGRKEGKRGNVGEIAVFVCIRRGGLYNPFGIAKDVRTICA